MINNIEVKEITFHKVEDETGLPVKSLSHVVVKLKSGMICDNHYSAEHKKFNCRDNDTDECGWGFEEIEWWTTQL